MRSKIRDTYGEAIYFSQKLITVLILLCFPDVNLPHNFGVFLHLRKDSIKALD